MNSKGDSVVSKEIKERRANSANVPEDQRAGLAAGKRKKSSFLSGVVLTVAVFVAILTLLLFLANGAISLLYTKFGDGDYSNEKITVADRVEDMRPYQSSALEDAKFSSMVEKATLNYNAMSSNIKADENVLNYLVLGIDKYTDDPSVVAHADIIMIVSVNKVTNKITGVKLNNRVLAYIPEVDKVGPLQDAYEWGGAALLAKTVSENFGIEINGYAEVTTKAFSGMVDAVGGINLALNDREIVAVNEAIPTLKEVLNNENIDDVYRDDTGRVKLGGNQMLAYLMTRNDKFSQLKHILKITGMNALTSGLGKCTKVAKALISNTDASVSRKEVTSLVGVGISFIKNPSAKFVYVGDKAVDRYSLNVHTVDYEAERTALITALYGASK